jgi:hypothetical protein
MNVVDELTNFANSLDVGFGCGVKQIKPTQERPSSCLTTWKNARAGRLLVTHALAAFARLRFYTHAVRPSIYFECRRGGDWMEKLHATLKRIRSAQGRFHGFDGPARREDR